MRLWLVVGVACVALAGVTILVAPVALGRTAPPSREERTAWTELKRAQRAGAMDWAPAMLERAATAFDVARVERRRQELRFVSFREFASARLGFVEAAALGRQARETAEQRRQAARQDARGAMLAAADRLDETARAAQRVRLSPEAQRAFSRARILIAQAGRLLAAGDFLEADRKARLGRAELERVAAHGAERTARYADPEEIERWRSLTRDAIEWSRRTGRVALLIVKEHGVLWLYERGRVVRQYPLDLGGNGSDRKLRAGDRATPEGRYHVVARKSGGQTRFYKALLLDYPNREDLRRFAAAKRAGLLERSARPGSQIEIHGEGGRGTNWTDGCPALSNEYMDDLFDRVEVGTPVTIVGGDGEGPLSDLHRTLVGNAADAGSSTR